MRFSKIVMSAVFMAAVAGCGAEGEPPESDPVSPAPSAELQATCTLWQYTCTTTHYLYDHDLAFCEANCSGGTCKKQPDCL